MSDNPLLAKLKLPGKIFQLPSRGFLYSNQLAENIQNGEVHVQPMSAFDEVVLKNPDMLFSGKALEPVFGNCVKDIVHPNDLYGKDVDALMVYLRLVTYGPAYEIIASHGCENGTHHTYVVDLEDVVNRIKYLDPMTIDEIYTIKLDNGQVIRLNPAKYSNIIEILQKNELQDEKNRNKEKLTIDEIKMNIELNLLSIIYSIDDIQDKELIKEWIKQAPANYIEKISNQVDKLYDFGVDTNCNLLCKDCGQTFSIDLPINPISFF